MRNYLPHNVYLFDYRSFLVRASVAVAIAVIVYSAFFDVAW
jgi:hypothetical protein